MFHEGSPVVTMVVSCCFMILSHSQMNDEGVVLGYPHGFYVF